MDERAGFEEHLNAPLGRGALHGSPHSGSAGGAACGDLIRVSVRTGGGRVAEAGFDASGCGAVTAAGSAAVALVAGRPLLDAALVGPGEIAAELGGLSPGKLHAAELAADALHRALGSAAVAGEVAAIRSDRTLVAMSGGVDSAVAALLEREAGRDVVAVTLELWRDEENDAERSCCSARSVLTARSLAHDLGIPHLTLDARDAFRTRVVDDFLAGYGAGLTPNPCVRCNGLVRFDAMLALAERIGAARLATGHYARIATDDGGPLLRAAADPAKDQSYMLARLGPAELERLSFPLGALTKPEVRKIARGASLRVADRPESQDLCFLAGTDRARFLRRHAATRVRSGPGEIVDMDGRTLGTHDGHEAFTVGQRRGLRVSAREPLYVVAKDAARNRVTVGPRAALARRRIPLGGLELRRPASVVDAVKLRYRSRAAACTLAPGLGPGVHDRAEVLTAEPVDSVAPGQVAVLLSGDRVVGCAVIAGALESSGTFETIAAIQEVPAGAG